MQHFIDWLYGTPLSHLIQTVTWIIPLTQCVHIVCISLLFSSMMMLDLRLLGVAGRKHSVEYYSHRFLPWLWKPLPILLVTGLILIIAEPNRDLKNVAFYTKMSLIIIASLMNYALQRAVRKDPSAFERSGSWTKLAPAVGAASILCWVGVIVAGRLIAYV